MSPPLSPFFPPSPHQSNHQTDLSPQQNSLLIIPPTHGVFHLTAPKKPSKRFGTLVKSEENNLGNMLVAHQEGVKEFIEQKMAAKGGKVKVAGVKRGAEKAEEGQMGV